MVRCAIEPLPDGSLNVLVRDSAADEFRFLLAIPAEDATSTDVVSFSGDGRTLLMISAAGADTGRLVRVDLATGDSTVLAADPEADVSGALLDPDTRDPQIVMILKDRMTYVVLDPSVAEDLNAVRALHPGDPSILRAERGGHHLAGRLQRRRRAPSPTSRTTGPRRRAGCCSPRGPRSTATSSRRWSRSPSTPATACSSTGTLTFPPGLGRTGLPAVVDVHGGPQVRDTWGYNPEAQWLANRGLPVRPGELPRLHRVREGLRRRRGPGVGRQDARRPGRRRGATPSPRAGRTGPGSPSTAAPTAGTRRWSGRRSRRTSSAARSTSSGRPT